ncbi:MAG: DUF1080 domain-containing protein [Pedosphaera sp.]|nr:DUF1080 domain-containing protein [Pedosphaera sp.]
MRRFFLIIVFCAGHELVQAELLFDGLSLKGWRETDFAGHGEIEIKASNLVINAGAALSGITWTNAFPTNNFEIIVEAKKVLGSDFFAAMTFPVDGSHATFVAGGWGGGVVGISSLDGQDASENETVKYHKFEMNQWYRFKVKVTPGKIEAWIDEKEMVNIDIKARKVSLRHGEIDLNKPFGIATYQTSGGIRRVELKRLGGPEAKSVKPPQAGQ